MNLADLKKSLSECHLTKSDTKTKFLMDVNDPNFYLHRIMECVGSCQRGEDIPENTKLAIQLMNLYRCNYSERLKINNPCSENENLPCPDKKDTK